MKEEKKEGGNTEDEKVKTDSASLWKTKFYWKTIWC